MAVSLINSLAPVTMTIFGGGLLTLPLVSMGFSTDILASMIHHSGGMSPTLVAVPGANPRIVLTMPLKIAYSTFGFTPKKLTTLDCYLSHFVDAIRDSAATHNRIHLDTGNGCTALAQLVGWTVNVDGIAMANIEIILLSGDGTDPPVLFENNVALPALSGTPSLHTLGPVTFDAVVYTGLAGVDVTINAPINALRSDGDLYPRVASRPQNAPSLSLSHTDAETILTTLGTLGLYTTSTVVYFKEYDPVTGVSNRDAGTAISVTLHGRLHPSGTDAQQGAVAGTGISVMPISTDGITFPLVVSVAASSPAE